LDDIGWTLQFEDKILDYERQARSQKPWLFFDL
jgi:3-isopropylmalate/(R)-2-methylmalate dehydratase small subunit